MCKTKYESDMSLQRDLVWHVFEYKIAPHKHFSILLQKEVSLTFVSNRACYCDERCYCMPQDDNYQVIKQTFLIQNAKYAYKYLFQVIYLATRKSVNSLV